MAHNRSTKAQKEYVKAIVQQLSLQRFSDTEIVQFLAEKGIKLARNTVNGITKQSEKSAEKWYIELKKSSYKYIATYKERLDSLLSYQKQLQDIVTTTKKEDTKIRALSTIATIEMNIFTIWKQLPELSIVDRVKQPAAEEEEKEEEKHPPIVCIEDINGVEAIPDNDNYWNDAVQCDECKRIWPSQEHLDYHQRHSKHEQRWAHCKCPNCEKWFSNDFNLSHHKCTNQPRIG
jgi:hypothetical protein